MSDKVNNKKVEGLKPIDYMKPVLSKDKDIEKNLDKHIFRDNGEGMKNVRR